MPRSDTRIIFIMLIAKYRRCHHFSGFRGMRILTVNPSRRRRVPPVHEATGGHAANTLMSLKKDGAKNACRRPRYGPPGATYLFLLYLWNVSDLEVVLKTTSKNVRTLWTDIIYGKTP